MYIEDEEDELYDEYKDREPDLRDMSLEEYDKMISLEENDIIDEELNSVDE